MRKPVFCICENSDADESSCNWAAVQCFGFLYIDRTIPLLPNPNFKPLAFFCGYTAQFVSDMVGNPKDRFSHNAAHKMH